MLVGCHEISRRRDDLCLEDIVCTLTKLACELAVATSSSPSDEADILAVLMSGLVK
jgi:hypothetical protein